MKLFIYAHDMASEGSKVLSEALGGKRIRRAKSRFVGSPDKIVINWGCRAFADEDIEKEIRKCRLLNSPEAVTFASNKLRFFQQFEGSDVRHVPFTTDESVVKTWLQEGRTVCARQVLTGSGGEGLKIFDGTQAFVTAPLWTQYVKKKDEYRIHVLDGKVIDIQQKKLKLVKPAERGGFEGVRGMDGIYDPATRRFENDPNRDKECVAPIIPNQDHRIRNLANGYIFARNEVTPPDDVLDQAKSVFNVLPLDFGAVDVIWNEKQKRAYVLEVNTAPGLEGSTIENYSKAFKSFESMENV